MLAHLMEQRQSCPSTAYQAARDVLDRTMGKAVETVKHQQRRHFASMSDAELESALRASIERLGYRVIPAGEHSLADARTES